MCTMCWDLQLPLYCKFPKESANEKILKIGQGSTVTATSFCVSRFAGRGVYSLVFLFKIADQRSNQIKFYLLKTHNI